MMLRDEMIAEISESTDTPINKVEDILDEEDCIIEEEYCAYRKKKCAIMTILIVIFLMGATVAVYVLDQKNKIDVEKSTRRYIDKLRRQLHKEA